MTGMKTISPKAETTKSNVLFIAGQSVMQQIQIDRQYSGPRTEYAVAPPMPIWPAGQDRSQAFEMPGRFGADLH
jgi:hypothetical protein